LIGHFKNFEGAASAIPHLVMDTLLLNVLGIKIEPSTFTWLKGGRNHDID
jgi:hypothetical protein